HLGAHELLHILPGQGTDLFQHGPLLADNDPLVAGLLTVDGGVHVDDAAVPLRELRDLHRRAVGDLLVQAQQQLLPQDFPHHLPLRLVRRHPVREQLRAFLGILPQFLHQILQAAAGVGGDGDDRVKAVPCLVVSGDH
ncbi:TIGR04076 family protein, partial [Dysosmobacter welbionis]